MIEIILGLLSTDLGKAVASVLALLLGLAGFRMKSVRDGRAQERARQSEASARAEQERIRTDDEIGRAGADDVRARLDRWVPDRAARN